MEEVEEGVGAANVAEVEQIPMFYYREYGTCLHESVLKPLRHTKVMKQAIHFWPLRLPFNCMVARVSYDAPGDIRASHPGCTNQL